MNRWRQRLAELRGESAKPPACSSAVQNVQNVRNPAPKSSFEHFEQIEQLTESREAPVLKASAANRRTSVWGEAEAERAAIVEHDGVIPREWAEGFARLDPDRPPGDVRPQRWLRFVDDVGLFLDSPFCASAAALGWGPYDLFGCDRDRPFARIDHLGLLWLLDGAQVIALTADTATIKRSNGSILTYRRRAGREPSNVLTWEL
jgi:hypothetical protein